MSSPDRKRVIKERKFWNKVAARYDGWVDSAFKSQYAVIKPKLASFINSEDVILEIGCGTGEISFFLASKCGKITGVDISGEMIAAANKKRAKSGVENASFEVADAYHLPYKEGSFDKVICVNALQTMKEPRVAIRQGRRVLKNGGEFISITYCYGDSTFFEKLKLVKWVILYGLPKYWHNFKTKTLKYYFINSDLEVINHERIIKKPVVLLIQARKDLEDSCLLK